MANTPKLLTQKELEEIEMMAGLGMKFDDIALIKGMSDDTLKKYAKEYLYRGKAKSKAVVMQTAYKLATSGKCPSMTMFWLKTQSAWRENMPDERHLQEKLTQEKPDTGTVEVLQQAIEEIQSGELDPKAASAIASLSTVLLKAKEQAELEERLQLVESFLHQQSRQQEASLMDTPLDGTFDGIEFISEAQESEMT